MEWELPQAPELLRGWSGRTIATVTGAANRILDVTNDVVIVATGRSPEGQSVPLAMVQSALDLLARDGRVTVDVGTLGHRRARVRTDDGDPRRARVARAGLHGFGIRPSAPPASTPPQSSAYPMKWLLSPGRRLA